MNNNIEKWIKRCDNLYVKFINLYYDDMNIKRLQINEIIYDINRQKKRYLNLELYIMIFKQIEDAYKVCFNKSYELINNIDDKKVIEEYKVMLNKREQKLKDIENKLKKEKLFKQYFDELFYIYNDFNNIYYDKINLDINKYNKENNKNIKTKENLKKILLFEEYKKYNNKIKLIDININDISLEKRYSNIYNLIFEYYNKMKEIIS